MKKQCGVPFTKGLLHPRHWLAWLGLGLAYLVSWLPTGIRHTIGRKIGDLTYQRNKKRRNIVLTNLRLAFPHKSKEEREDMARRHLQWYGCALVDYSLTFFASRKRLTKMIRMNNSEHIDKALAENKSIILFLAHSVMLDFSPPVIGYHYPAYGSYKTIKNPVFDWMVARSRCRTALFLITRDEGMLKLARELKPGQILIFLPDEDLGAKHSTFAPFFGVQKATLKSPARLAKMGKAVSLLLYVWFNPDSKRYEVDISDPLENFPAPGAEKSAEILNTGLEKMIAVAPDQYMWLLKIFKTRPTGEKAVY